jgi:hypothetical protein
MFPIFVWDLTFYYYATGNCKEVFRRLAEV